MTVIKRTRLKFFIVMAAIVTMIIAAFCASILLYTHSRNTTETDAVLRDMLLGFDNYTPEKPPNENRFNQFRGFAVKLNSDFEIIETNHNGMVYSEAQIIGYVAIIKDLNKTSGETNNIKFLLKDVENGKILACLDTGMEISMFKQLLTAVLLAGGGSLVVLLVLLWFLSFWIIKPAADAFKKQKRFISEAGHELKTPLTVIVTSLELLQKNSDCAENEKLLKSIKEQAEKMSTMTTELLTLSKIDETESRIVLNRFDLSQTVLTEALAFESVAFERGKKLVCEIENGLLCKGDYAAVRKTVAILCDNAIKHSDPDDTITVRLKKMSAKTVLSVSNECNSIKKDELPLLFERFYRGSESRAETDGAGLGLSILKNLADKNGWTFDASLSGAKGKQITFFVAF